MGYDMSTVDENGNTVRDCDDPEHGEHYWRRNVFGAGPQAERLEAVGMGYWPRTSGIPGAWPDVEGAEYGEYDEELDECPPLNDQAREERRLTAEYMKATYDERPGIALYKLCNSNDGWWVTKAECESALKLWEQAGKPSVDDYGDTIPFLRAGAAHGGFRVW
jgi:hypothetical protein